jgi:hypothetical protein
MLIKKEQEKKTYVNIANGLLQVGKDENKETFSSIKGKIVYVEFFEEQFQGEVKKKAKFHINSEESYILQMNLDSGYFRSLCNSLKSGNPHEEITITPKLKEDGKTVCFVEQNGKYLKHYFTKDFNGKDGDILPELTPVIFKGATKYDNTNQLNYWKNWLKATYGN